MPEGVELPAPVNATEYLDWAISAAAFCMEADSGVEAMVLVRFAVLFV